jgi:hypothetical protein
VIFWGEGGSKGVRGRSSRRQNGVATSSTVMYNFGVGPRFAFVSASARAPK